MRNLVYCLVLLLLLSFNPVFAIDDNPSINILSDVPYYNDCIDSEQLFVLHLKNRHLENLYLLQQNNVTIYKIINNMAQVSTNCDNLDFINNLEFVDYIHRPSHPTTYEYTIESLDRLRIPEVHDAGLKGKDIKVVVIDTGFAPSNSEISQNVIMSRSFCSSSIYCPLPPAPRHGTAVAEIIVDIAPEADLYLFDVGFAIDTVDAIKYASEVIDADIISMSLGFNAQPTDGTGIIDQAIDNARSLGTLTILAAGNDGQQHFSQIFRNSENNWHLFDTGDSLDQRFEFEVESNWGSVILSWYDGGYENSINSRQDLDLYLYRKYSDGSTQLVDSSMDRQAWRVDLPYEAVSIKSTGSYFISIRNYSLTKEIDFRLLWRCSCTPESYTPSGSVGSPASSKGGLAVGAIAWNENTITSYSSQGPTQDGRIKPDVVAPSHVSTSIYGQISWANEGFSGTSASAPHVAGVAALIKSANPSLDADDLFKIITSSAIGDFGIPGKDNVYGSGLIQSAMTLVDTFPKSSIIIDDVRYHASELPIAKIWPVGSSHTLHYEDHCTRISGTECYSRNQFHSWEDSTTNRNRNYVFDGGIDILNATAIPFHKITIQSEYGELQSDTERWNSLPSSKWYNESVATLSLMTNEINHQNDTRRSLDGWYIGNTLMSRDSTIKLDVFDLQKRWPIIIDIYWEKEYALKIESTLVDDLTTDTKDHVWLPAGENSVVVLENLIHENEFTRSNLIQYNIIDSYSNFPNSINDVTRSNDDYVFVDIFMNNPKSLETIHKLQHKLDINAEFISSNTHQSISNQIKSISPTNDLYLDSDTEFILDSDYIWSNSETSRKRISNVTINDSILELDSIVLDDDRLGIPISMHSPQFLELFSVNDYYVSLDSIFSTTGEGWYEENTIASVSISDNIIQNNALDRFKWISWNNINCNQPCDLTNNEIQFLVNSPESISTNHITQYFLEILPSYSYSGENLWLDKDSIFTFTVPDVVVNHQNNTRHVFTKWSNDDTNEEISLRIDRPHVIDSLWNTEHLLTLQFFDSINRELEPSVITMSSPDGEQHTFDPLIEENKVWLRPGEWSINSIIWQDVDVKRNMNSIIIDESKSLELEVNVHDSVIVLKDLIFPLSDIPVEISFVNGTVKELLSDQDGKISLTGIPLGQYAGNVDYFLQSKYFVYDEKLAIDNVTEQTFFFGRMSSIIYFSIFILIGLFIRKSRT